LPPAARPVARLTEQWLSERLGQQFIIENRTGADQHRLARSVADPGLLNQVAPAPTS
jgi:hypothetical protein